MVRLRFVPSEEVLSRLADQFVVARFVFCSKFQPIQGVGHDMITLLVVRVVANVGALIKIERVLPLLPVWFALIKSTLPSALTSAAVTE